MDKHSRVDCPSYQQVRFLHRMHFPEKPPQCTYSTNNMETVKTRKSVKERPHEVRGRKKTSSTHSIPEANLRNQENNGSKECGTLVQNGTIGIILA